MKTGCGANDFVPDIETEDKSKFVACGLPGLVIFDGQQILMYVSLTMVLQCKF